MGSIIQADFDIDLYLVRLAKQAGLKDDETERFFAIQAQYHIYPVRKDKKKMN